MYQKMKSCRYCKLYNWKYKECRLLKKEIKDVYIAQKCKKYKEVSPITKEIRKDIYRRFRRFG